MLMTCKGALSTIDAGVRQVVGIAVEEIEELAVAAGSPGAG